MAVITKSNENQPVHTIRQQQKSLMSHYFNTINQEWPDCLWMPRQCSCWVLLQANHLLCLDIHRLPSVYALIRLELKKMGDLCLPEAPNETLLCLAAGTQKLSNLRWLLLERLLSPERCWLNGWGKALCS